MTEETCTITVKIREGYDGCYGYDLENVVKNAWSYMTPWFTHRHGVRSGSIALNGGTVEIAWNYDECSDEIVEDVA